MLRSVTETLLRKLIHRTQTTLRCQDVRLLQTWNQSIEKPFVLGGNVLFGLSFYKHLKPFWQLYKFQSAQVV